MMKITLASTSPRRKEMLGWLGLEFDAVAPAIDESTIRHSDPETLTQLLAEAKAEAVKDQAKGGIIIGSDSIVCFNNQILEKAKDKNHQRELIKVQRGQKRQISYSGRYRTRTCDIHHVKMALYQLS